MPNRTIGQQILKKALTAPFRKILENANKDYAEVVTEITIMSAETDIGYDARKDKYVIMENVGIIDPAKVERCALENAISNAAQFITMSASITETQPKKND
jgi:chaperonin GroEL